MGLSPKEKQILIQNSAHAGAKIWTQEELEKLKEIKSMLNRSANKITPAIIAKSNIFPDKTYAQIRCKFYGI